MVFHSLTFLCLFLPLSLLTYYFTPRKWRNVTLLLLSIAFLLLGDPWYAPFLLASVVCDAFLARGIAANRGRTKARRLLVVGVGKSIILLLLLKQYVGMPLVYYRAFPILGLLIPLGLVTVCLKSVSYLADVFLEKAPVQKNLVDLAVYELFFPTLPFGPAVLYHDFVGQLDASRRRTDAVGWITAGWFFCKGLAMVVLFSNSYGYFWNLIIGQLSVNTTVFTALPGVLCAALSILFLWSGYQDMAKGLAGLFGFTFRKADNFPLLASSMSDLILRIDGYLAKWMHLYAHNPILTIDNPTICWIVNIIFFFLFKGFFTGDMYTLLLWLAALVLYLLIDRIVYRRWIVRWSLAIRRIYTLLFALFCITVFALPDASQFFIYLQAMTRLSTAIPSEGLLQTIAQPLLILLVCTGICGLSPALRSRLRKLIYRHPRQIPWLLIPIQLILLSICLVAMV